MLQARDSKIKQLEGMFSNDNGSDAAMPVSNSGAKATLDFEEIARKLEEVKRKRRELEGGQQEGALAAG